jgi:hypothetical protein
MYGLVNKAVHDLVCSKFGEDTWRAIVARAGLDIESFVSMQSYDDAITYKLVGAASEQLGLTPAQVLHTFGVYWTTYTAVEGYGDLITSSGHDVVSFLENLDNMHTRVQLTFPELRPPSFQVERDDDGVLLHYISDREGLAPMVIGLLEGLGAHFNEEIEVTHVQMRSADSHDVFRLRTRAKGG